MCGYIGNLHQSPAVLTLLSELGVNINPFTRLYNRHKIEGLITAHGDGYLSSSAIWWYKLQPKAEGFDIDTNITSFNARDLDKPLWKNAIKNRRGIIFGTEIGESKDKDRFLMKAPEGLALGALYKDWKDGSGNTQRSMAIITRPPHAKFSQYHDKSIPCFLPLNINILTEWLDPKIETSAIIDDILSRPRIYNDLDVHKVKTYKDGKPIGKTGKLKADEDLDKMGKFI